MPVTSLPPAQDTELSLSVERAYRESLVTDRLGAIWSLILAKCFLAQWAILRFEIPISGPRYIWTLTLIMGIVASAYYLHAHRVRLYLLPTHFRVNAAVLAGLVVALGFVAYAYFARGLLSAPLAAAIPAAKPATVLPVCTTVANPAMAAQSIMPSAPRLTMPAFSLIKRPRAAMARTVPALSVAPIRSA